MNKLRVLLADDHIVMHTGLCALLERQPNLEVIGECENGRETVELAASLRPDVVVMDIGMPMLNGIEATNEVAAWRSFASIQAIPGTKPVLQPVNLSTEVAGVELNSADSVWVEVK